MDFYYIVNMPGIVLRSTDLLLLTEQILTESSAIYNANPELFKDKISDSSVAIHLVLTSSGLLLCSYYCYF